ncbi:glycoside hydrolase family 131 protein [Curvularia clavata]|uniref:Glycoside hydrolase family 131 protein n=1 Tax=Curvularia clavata TaxID=95742 RepID=A0A9Q8Z8N5_CURCL|nr:glycoside hydrolase family 131 protein [Curvularia clavata]
MFTQTLFSMALAASAAFAAPTSGATPKCPIVFDGRVPVNATPESFDTAATNTIFNAGFVKGNNLTWSQILKFPKVEASRFDCGFKAVEVTISDASIFQKQLGFRRAELQFLKDAADGEGGKGVKTLHWSVKQDPQRPLNLTHEYLNVWHEAADFSSNQIQFQTGSLIGKSDADKASFKILDRNNTQLFAVPMDMTNWQNFAATLDFNKNQVTIFYSAGKAALKKVAGPLNVNLAGGGQYHMGMLKKPTGTSDVANAGFQESPLNEGQIYGGLFLEDSSNGCVSL